MYIVPYSTPPPKDFNAFGKIFQQRRRGIKVRKKGKGKKGREKRERKGKKEREKERRERKEGKWREKGRGREKEKQRKKGCEKIKMELRNLGKS